MRKKLILFFIILILLCANVHCFAIESSRFLQSVKLSDNSIVIYTDSVNENDQFNVVLGTEELQFDIQTVNDAEEPITFFCLVDISGSMQGNSINLVKEILIGLNNNMREQDKMIIATFDNHLSVGTALKAGEELISSIENISVGSEDTNLYSAIIESIQFVSYEQTYDTKKCLVIFSDGREYQDNGATESEVLTAVEQSEFPIYTVATMISTKQLEGGKVLGSFGRQSAGGEHFTTANEEGGGKSIRFDIVGSDIADSIWTDMLEGIIITADLTNYIVDRERSEIVLSITLSNYDTNITEERSISTDELSEIIIENSSSHKINLILVAVFAGIFIFVVGLLIVVVLKRSKKNNSKARNEEQCCLEMPIDNFYSEERKEPLADIVNVNENSNTKNTVPVFMLEIPYGRNPISFKLSSQGDKLTVGRSDRADVILNKTDSQLSGIHFSLKIMDDKYYVMDENSTNGTFLNGIKIFGSGWRQINSSDKVRAGGVEYRILFGKDAIQNSGQFDAR